MNNTFVLLFKKSLNNLFFGGNLESARALLKSDRYIPNMLSKSRFNRRIHRISGLFLYLLQVLGEIFKELNKDSIYLIDSFPVAVCDNIRISRSKIYKDEAFRGYIASKRRYFYGLRIHLVVTKKGQPVEFFLSPASANDVNALKVFNFDLPRGSKIYADAAYNDYLIEDLLKEHEVYLYPIRRKNSKRPIEPPNLYFQHYYRQQVETAGSLINRLMPKSIHAVISKGFELKILLFTLAYSMNFIL
jgi:hypothetical protein